MSEEPLGLRESRLAPRLVRIEPDVFHEAAGAAERLIGHDVVAARWEQSSVLDGYTVAGLAGHLARAVLTVERYLDAPAPTADSDYTDAAGYFTNVLGTDDPIDSERHRRIRARGAETAADGPEALATELGDARLRLEGRLSPAVMTQPIQARDGIAVTVGEYLKTRVVELVVHLDDLALSVGHTEPEGLPAAAFDMTAAVLARVATRRAGGLVTVRSLARRERHPNPVRAL